MVDLTDDEFTVLSIAAQGQSMMAVARWEKPTDLLVEKGLMRREDKFNNFITSAGVAALEGRGIQDAKKLEVFAESVVKVHNSVIMSREYAEQAAQLLLKAAQETSKANGKPLDFSIKKWAQEIEARALSLANG